MANGHNRIASGPFHQSTLFWGCVSAVIAIVITVVVAMIKDARLLLIFAWPFAAIAAWEFARTWGPPRRIKWIAGGGGLASAIALLALYLWLAPEALHVQDAQSQKDASSPTAQSKGSAKTLVPVLHRHYATGDRERLSELLFTIYGYLNDNVSPPQLEIHRLSTALRTPQTMKRLEELRNDLDLARRHLDNLAQANGYYRDEIQDVLGVGDPLNADIVAIKNYTDAISAISPEPQDRAARIIQPSWEALREANFNLGTWVSDCNHRISAKRDALQ